MTPAQTMMKFEKRYAISTALYERLQAIYTDALIKDGLFTNEKLLEREYHLIAGSAGTRPTTSDQALATSGLYLFSVWRNNKSIFRFDEDMARQVVSARVPPDIPASTLQRLPHWCVYIELPRAAKRAFMDAAPGAESLQILGFWAACDKRVSGGSEWLLKIYLHVDDKGDPNSDLSVLKPISIPISDGVSITKSTALAQTEGTHSLTCKISRNIGALSTMVSLLLCLCVDEPDVTDVVGLSLTRQQLIKPRYKHVKSRKVFEASIQPHYYEIGVQEGVKWRNTVRRLENDVMTGRASMDSYVTDGEWINTPNGLTWADGKIK